MQKITQNPISYSLKEVPIDTITIWEMVPKVLSKRDAVRICKVITVPSQAIELIEKIKKYSIPQLREKIQKHMK